MSARLNFKTNKEAPTEQKIRGGYYTPSVLADYLCRWAIRSPSDQVLEPSCGDGSFIVSAASLLDGTGQMTAIEIVEREIEKARESINGSRVPTEWKCGSFFDVAATLLGKREYDVALGNPPFIRFQHFDKQERGAGFSAS